MLTGKNLIACRPVDSADGQFTAGGTLAAFEEASGAHVDQALEAAAEASHEYRQCSADARAGFLDRVAQAIESSGDLVALAHVETALPPERLAGERARTVGQLRMFANLVREGSWVDARIDRALPDRTPLAKPDVRRMLIPLGPVAVFGASNFPLAFSVAGGDTASALAAGTPADLAEHTSLVSILEEKAGRLIFNGFPTGVEVCAAMQHGGPYPATTDSRSSSVGAAAIHRFVRPVAYQDFPQSSLPVELQDANPRAIWRLVDGELTRAGW